MDAVVDDDPMQLLGGVGNPVALRLHRPPSPDDLALVRDLRRWAHEDRIVEVILDGSGHVALVSDGQMMRVGVLA